MKNYQLTHYHNNNMAEINSNFKKGYDNMIKIAATKGAKKI